jgi:hypothetical protein
LVGRERALTAKAIAALLNSSKSGSPRNGILGHLFASWRYALIDCLHAQIEEIKSGLHSHDLAAANKALQNESGALSVEIAVLKEPASQPSLSRAEPSNPPSTTRHAKRKKGKK